MHCSSSLCLTSVYVSGIHLWVDAYVSVTLNKQTQIHREQQTFCSFSYLFIISETVNIFLKMQFYYVINHQVNENSYLGFSRHMEISYGHFSWGEFSLTRLICLAGWSFILETFIHEWNNFQGNFLVKGVGRRGMFARKWCWKLWE